MKFYDRAFYHWNIRLNYIEGFAFGHHDSTHIRYPLLGQIFGSTQDHWQRAFHYLYPTFNLTGDRCFLSFYLQMRNDACKWKVQQSSQHRRYNPPIIIYGFLTGEDDVILHAFKMSCQQPGSCFPARRIMVYPDRIIGSDRQTFANDLIGFRSTDVDDGDLPSQLFFKFEGTDQCIPFIVRIENILNSLIIKSCMICIKFYFSCGFDDTSYAHYNFHKYYC